MLPRAGFRRGIIALWAVILVAVCGRAALAPGRHSVYAIFANASRNWWTGEELYRSGVLDHYRGAPVVAALTAPFAVLPERLGEVVWRLFQAVVFLGALAWWGRVVLPRPLTANERTALFLLVVPLSVGSLNNGQTNPLVIGLLLAAGAAVVRQRWNLAALAVGLACAVKLYPVAVGLLLAAILPRRFAGRFALALLALAALPFVLQEPGYVARQYLGWFRLLGADDRAHLPLECWYRDLRLFFRVWLVPIGPTVWPAVQLLTAAGICGVGLAGRRSGWPERRLVTSLLGLACCWMTVLGPATESCTYILVAPTLAWAVIEVWNEPEKRMARLVLGTTFALFAVSQAAAWFPGGKFVHALGPQPFAGLLLLTCLLAAELKRVAGHAGKLTRKVLPWPGVESTAMVPPIRST